MIADMTNWNADSRTRNQVELKHAEKVRKKERSDAIHQGLFQEKAHSFPAKFLYTRADVHSIS